MSLFAAADCDTQLHSNKEVHHRKLQSLQKFSIESMRCLLVATSKRWRPFSARCSEASHWSATFQSLRAACSVWR